ncbi:MAG: 1-(5-phosphoribosyl)-5-[(5-phosphoribosylamino)methylideneamino]imidazole-4-carboxamide isomerase [Verrucomicrobiota bacterium]|jgi:phosphoribosylformimino-5-aminoimidazole carboxamide ribotide isomerase
MLLYPAIDIMGGQVVRLERGEAAKKTVYGTDPVAMALKWEAAGADWIHLVDLDAAFEGVSRNLEVIRAIVSAVSVPCELGGGMRDASSIEAGLATGVRRVIIGTKAAEPGFLAEAAGKFGPSRLAVGIDAKDGRVAVKGWVETMELSALDLAREALNTGIRTIIYTDIATDGMLQGPNIAAMREMATEVPCDLIASGGVSGPEDVRQLAGVSGLHGVIIGRALYERRMPEDLRTILG